MPAMINRLMPLPMPYSSICSPSHIRNTVPAVMVITPVNCHMNGSDPLALRNCSWIKPFCMRNPT